MSSKNIRSLDGIRGLAVLIVLVAHYLKDVNLLWPEIKYLGQLGVMIFFALSGYLMMLVTQDLLPTNTNVNRFLYRRIARVYPLFLFIIITSYVISLLIEKDVINFSFYFKSINNISDVFEHLLLIKGGNSILWSIGVEILFYLIFPVIWMAKSKGSYWFFLSIGMIVLFQVFTNYAYDKELHFSRLNLHLHYFLIGCVSFWICTNSNILKWLSDRWIINVIFFIGIVFLVFSLPISYNFIFDDDKFYNFKLMWVNNIFAMLAVFLLLITASSKMSQYIFARKAICFLGTISYSTYLTHRIIQTAFDHYFVALSFYYKIGILLFFIMPLCIFVGYLSYKLIEAPSREFFYRRR